MVRFQPAPAGHYPRGQFDPARISRYEDLADPELNAGICIRSSNNVYNQSLLASMISHEGVEQPTEWARGLAANLARPPQGEVDPAIAQWGTMRRDELSVAELGINNPEAVRIADRVGWR